MENIDLSSTQAALKDLEKGVTDLFTSGEFTHYLDVMSRFHNYSANNCLLIMIQNPEATMVAGYHSWKDNFHRQVTKGQKGIKILAPSPHKVKIAQDKIDPDTHEKVLDKDGKPVKETVLVDIPSFHWTTVFDVAQTEGEPLPEIAHDLEGSVKDFDKIFEAIKEAAPCPITFEDIEGGAQGYFVPGENRIAIQSGMSEIQTLHVAIHEMTHATLHTKEQQMTEKKTRNQKELEAEGTAYVVSKALGMDIGEDMDGGAFSFGYLAEWSEEANPKQLIASLGTIQKTADQLIQKIEGALFKDREITKEQEVPSIEDIKARHKQAVAKKQNKNKSLTRAS